MATIYSGYSVKWKPSGAGKYRRYRTRLDYWLAWETETQICYDGAVYVNIDYSISATYSGGMNNGARATCKTVYDKAKTVLCIGTQGYVYDKGAEEYNAEISGFVSSKTGSWTGQALWVGATVTIPALKKKTITFNANGGDESSLPQTQVKYYGTPLTISDTIPTKTASAFTSWNTSSDGTGTTYLPSQEIPEPTSASEALPLYAQWTWLNQPTCEYEEIVDTANMQSPTKDFSVLTVVCKNIQTHADGREPVNVKLKVGSQVSTPVTAVNHLATVSITPTTVGTFPVALILTDTIGGSEGAVREYPLGEITVVEPQWKQTVTFTTDMPDIMTDGNADIVVKAKNYPASVTAGEDVFDTIEGRFAVKGTNGAWSFDIILGSNYVSSTTSQTPSTSIKATYRHTVSNEKEYRTAFYNTTRNANFSTGLANTMFISGCSYPNFSSRVWWSQVNNPLYFPDTNYVEVGSNDTSVQGLIKIGDYLGAIKQSKTTDTAIYLLYPTSFDDETTYAIKQGVQGVGAIAKYSFNILGDETLFLSPNGVMAIVPSEDEEHKVQNRSFFIDGELLKESNIGSSYSFVYDGKYYLAVNDHCYVLDGNQKNSWGNDKTNLVYECYYLDNIPASCFMKYNNELWFSNAEYVCRFTDNSYEDIEGTEVTPVKAEWSTILDDDGSLHYYKTMNKKGNVVSVLPRASEHTEVLIKKDNEEPVLIQRTFSEASDIPSELYVNKKFKKYKRLQIIVRNEKAEGFGVDSIVKSYSLGSYAKR